MGILILLAGLITLGVSGRGGGGVDLDCSDEHGVDLKDSHAVINCDERARLGLKTVADVELLPK